MATHHRKRQRPAGTGAVSLPSLRERIRPLKILLMDVDGVLTDGSVFYGTSGVEIKQFHIQDGMGIDLAIRAGLKVGIITGRQSDLVDRRAKELGMTIVMQGYYDKVVALNKILKEEGIPPNKIGYVGDDLLDLGVMEKVGFRAAPSNAVKEVKQVVDYVCRSGGGQGAVREVVDLILEIKGAKGDLIEKLMDRPSPNRTKT